MLFGWLVVAHLVHLVHSVILTHVNELTRSLVDPNVTFNAHKS